MQHEQIREIMVTGGLPPYTAAAGAGRISSTKENVFTYTASSIYEDTYITIYDSAGSSKKITIKIIKELGVTPSTAWLKPEEHKEFSIIGGFGDNNGIAVVTLLGSARFKSSENSIDYTAPFVTGSDIIFVSDRSGQHKKVEINVVSENFYISPLSAVRLMGEEVLLNAVQPAGKVVWTCDRGDFIQQEETDHAAYVPPEEIGVYHVTATDDLSNKAEAVVHVVSELLLISPKTVFVSPGDLVEFKVARGAGDYTFVATSGYAGSLKDDKVTYLAPWLEGEYYFTVMDRAGSNATARIVVSGERGFEPVCPSDVVYDIVTQIKDVAAPEVIDNGESFTLRFTLNYNPQIPLPVKIYFRWCLPQGGLFYVKPWDSTAPIKEWGLNLVPETISTCKLGSFAGQFPLAAKMFTDFPIYGGFFLNINKNDLKDIGGSGTYRFEVIIKPVGAIFYDEYTIPFHLQVE